MTAQLAAQPGPGPDPRRFLYIPAGRLVIDQRVQRGVADEKIHRIQNEFDWSLFEALTVVAVGNAYLVTEGQHRGLACQGIDPDLLVPCLVLPATKANSVDQAQIALDIVKGRSGHSAYEQWHLRSNAGHAHEFEAEKVLAKHGLRLGKSPSTSTIAAVATVAQIIHAHKFHAADGAEHLDRILTVLVAAFPDRDHESSKSRWDRDMLRAVNAVIIRNPETLVPERLAKVLRTRPAAQWINIGRKSIDGSPWWIITQGIYREYNRSLKRGRLT
jgi:hypothetical protein